MQMPVWAATHTAIRHSRNCFANMVTATLFCGMVAGCGGGGGKVTPVASPAPPASPSPMVTPTPSPTVTPTPSPTVAPTPSPTPSPQPGTAKERASANDFQPNYLPTDSERYLRWASNNNLRVFLHPVVDNVKSAVPSASMNAGRALATVEKAVNLWSAATGNDFGFAFVADKADADIEIYFVDELRRADGSVANGVGVTNYTFIFPDSTDMKRGILRSAVIQIKTGQGDAATVDTAAHELGHTLGIEKHSSDAADILFATSLPPADITQRDQNTAFFLYYSQAAIGGRSAKTVNPSAVHTGEVVCNP